MFAGSRLLLPVSIKFITLYYNFYFILDINKLIDKHILAWNAADT